MDLMASREFTCKYVSASMSAHALNVPPVARTRTAAQVNFVCPSPNHVVHHDFLVKGEHRVIGAR